MSLFSLMNFTKYFNLHIAQSNTLVFAMIILIMWTKNNPPMCLWWEIKNYSKSILMPLEIKTSCESLSMRVSQTVIFLQTSKFRKSHSKKVVIRISSDTRNLKLQNFTNYRLTFLLLRVWSEETLNRDTNPHIKSVAKIVGDLRCN